MLSDIVSDVESKTGYIFNKDEITNIVVHTVRKCKLSKKESSYISILFENELHDYVMRAHVNLRSKQNRLRKSAAQAALM